MTDLLRSLFEKNTIYRITEVKQDQLFADSRIHTVVAVPQLPLEDAYAQQLAKIIAACKLLPEQILTVDYTTKWNALRQAGSIRHILLFGISEEQLGLNIRLPLHHTVSFDGRNWIRTLTIEALEEDTAAKTELWQHALKPLFVG